MALELYWISGSPFAWSTMLALEIKGLAYESRRLDAGKREHKSPDYLAMNPRGKVPVLKDGDTVIYESIAILAYLESKHPEPPLFGTTPQKTGHIWQRISEVVYYVSGPIFDDTVMPIFRGEAIDGGDGAEAVRAAAGPAHEALAWTDGILAGDDYLAGAAVSAADVVLVPIIQGLARAAGKEEATPLDLGFLPLGDTYPNIAAWLTLIESLPGYEDTYPPHWRE